MKIKLIAVLVPMIVLFSCGKEDTSEDNELNPDTFVNDLKVTITGARGGSYHITGEDVGVGCFGFTNNQFAYFYIGFLNENINFSTGMFAPDVTKRMEQEGIGGSAEYGTNWKDKFSAINYWMFYETEEPEYKGYTWMTITRFENRVDKQLTSMVHNHVTGTFRFKASNMPDVLLEAAILDAWNRGENGTPVPLYLPELAGTSKIEASGSFDVMFTTFIY